MINPRIDCSQSPLDVRLTPEECVALDLADPRRSDEWIQFADEVRRAIQAKPLLDHVYQCGGGVSSFAIDPYGRLSICVLSEAHKYDIRTGSFREGWEGFLHQQRVKKITRPTKCVTCTLKSVCGMCPANGELENGDPEAPVDWLCRVAHLRAMALDIPITPHGDCEYCDGGSGHAHLADAATRLRREAGTIPQPPPTVTRDGSLFLRVVNGPAASSCGSCGTH
jgi:radical SAM protein with 4Fe4S-binding SPASM domain